MKSVLHTRSAHWVLALIAICISASVVAAPFCSVTAVGTSCIYYDVQTCRSAAGLGGACVANTNTSTNTGSDSPSGSRSSPRFIDRNPVLDRMRENEGRRAEPSDDEVEPRRERRQDSRESDAPRRTPLDPNAPIVLVCQLRGPGLNEEYTVTVDLVKQTANGRTAQISNTYILWEREKQGQRFEFAINRFSGVMTVTGRNPRDGAQGKCDALSQTDRRF